MPMVDFEENIRNWHKEEPERGEEIIAKHREWVVFAYSHPIFPTNGPDHKRITFSPGLWKLWLGACDLFCGESLDMGIHLG